MDNQNNNDFMSVFNGNHVDVNQANNQDIQSQNMFSTNTLNIPDNKSIDNVTFYQELLNKCYFIHFEDDELDIITKYFNNCDYNNYMFNLFKHAIKNYKISTPKILAQRLLGDATTLTNEATTSIRTKSANMIKSFLALGPMLWPITSPIDFPSCLTDARSEP